MTLKPKIVIQANTADYDRFFRTFKQVAPKNININFDDGENLAAKLEPEYVPRDKKINLDEITQAPHVLLYVFSCATKQIYLSMFQSEIRQWLRQNTKLYIHPLVVYINDPKITKSKNIFSGFNSFYQQLQEEIPKLLTVVVQSDQIIKEEMQKIWAAVTDEIRISYQDRITFLRDNIRAIDNVDTIRTYVNLSQLYQQATLCNRTIEFAALGYETIRAAPQFFKSFFSDKYFSYPFDFKSQIEDYEKEILDSMAGQYEILYILFKRQIQNMSYMQKSEQSIKIALEFLVYINQKVNSGEPFYAAQEPNYHFWLCQALTNIISECKAEDNATATKLSDQMISTTNWYLRELQTLMEITKSAEKVSNKSKFLVIAKIVESQESYQKEVISRLSTIINAAKSKGLSRIESLAAIELFKLQQQMFKQGGNEYNFSAEETELYKKSLLTVVKNGFTHLIPEITREQLNRLTWGTQILVACIFLSNSVKRYLPLAVDILNESFASYPGPKVYITTNFPLEIKIFQSEPFIINRSVELKAQIKWDIPEFKVEVMAIAFAQKQQVTISTEKYNWFTADNVTITNGAEITFTGRFKKFSLTPIVVGFWSKNNMVQIFHPLLPTATIVSVVPEPNRVDLEVIMPEFLLPNRTQHCQIIITTRYVERELNLQVTGLITHPARLRRSDGKFIDPTNGLIYSNVPPGRHTLILPIMAQQSGNLHVELLSSDQKKVADAPFKVMDILDMKIVYNEETQTAELTSSLETNSEVKINEVTFVGADGQELECKAFGVPMTVEVNPSYAVFILPTPPVVANVLVQHGNLKPFTLSIDVERTGEEAEVNEQITPPLTPFVPIEFKLAVQSSGYSEKDEM